MAVGTQYVAPEGYAPLDRQAIYYRVGRSEDKKLGRLVHLVHFGEKPSATLLSMAADAFERGLSDGSIVESAEQKSLPPWLADLEGQNLSVIDLQPRRLSRGKITHAERVDQRLSAIAEAVQHWPFISSHPDPVRAMNTYAARVEPPVNTTRFKTWLLTYLCFGQDKWSLLPPMHKNGRWSRAGKQTDKGHPRKFGRTAKRFGHRAQTPCDDTMRKGIKEGYLRFARNGKGLQEIYKSTLRSVFRCVPCKDSRGYDHWRSLTGKPFPTFDQFRYECERIFGRSAIEITLYGQVRTRNDRAPVRGRYSEGVAHAMQKVSTDASFSKQVPRGYKGRHKMPRLCMVIVVCHATGAIVGIGFSLKGEKARAYNMALFCAAIDKQKWGRLFGMTITEADIPGRGLPANAASDRGKFTASDVQDALEFFDVGAEMSPTHTPQSNANAESKHDKEIHLRGEPSYEEIDLDPTQLARRMINDCIEKNRSGSAQSRVTTEMVGHISSATPLAIWEFLDSRGRNDAIAISFEDAVRRFLTPVEFRSRDGMLWLKEMRYHSRDLEVSGLPAKIRKKDGVIFQGYVVDLAVRYAWVEYQGRLIEVEVQQAIRGDDEELFISLEELEEYAEEMRELRAIGRDGRPAVGAAMDIRSEEEIGPESTTSRRRRGKPETKTAEAQEEMKHADMASKTSKRKGKA